MRRHVTTSLALLLVLCSATLAQTTNFTPVEGANLKAKIDGAIAASETWSCARTRLRVLVGSRVKKV